MEFAETLESPEPDECAPYPKILQWSVDKITDAKRRKGGADLRRNLLIANVIFKARSSILQQRTRQFLQQKPQLQPPCCQVVVPSQETSDLSPSTPEPLASSTPEEPLASSTPEEPIASSTPEEPIASSTPELATVSPLTSAFGYGPSVPEASPDVPPSELSASAEAIVLSSVQLSIQELEEEPSGHCGEEKSSDKGARKRKMEQQQQAQQQHELQYQHEYQYQYQEDPVPRPHSPPKRNRPEEVYVLQNSFCDLSVEASTVEAAFDNNDARQQQQQQPIYRHSCQFGGHFLSIGGCVPSLACPT